MSDRLAELPADAAALRRTAQGLVIHYRADDPFARGIPAERLGEVDTRYADEMLRRLFELDGRPLEEARPPARRLVGCCRDFTVLFLTLARHRGIPARARVGFATYFVPGFNLDHEVAEVWVGGRWHLVDAELDEDHVDATDGTRLNPLDVPRDRFLVPGEAWRACRDGRMDPETFVVDPGLDVPDTRGWPYLRHNLIHDLAALNKAEMLLWDEWGLMERERLSEDELALLDEVAEATLTTSVLDATTALYEKEPDLRVPDEVTSYSPTAETPHTITLRA